MGGKTMRLLRKWMEAHLGENLAKPGFKAAYTKRLKRKWHAQPAAERGAIGKRLAHQTAVKTRNPRPSMVDVPGSSGQEGQET